MNIEFDHILGDDELGARLRTTFNTVMPLLDAPPATTTSPSAASTSDTYEDALTFDLPSPPSSSSGRRMTGVLAAAAALIAVAGGAWLLTDIRHQPSTDTGTTATQGDGVGPSLSTLVVAADAGRWLDLADEPADLVRVVNTDLAASTVCTATETRHDELECTVLEGQIASSYLPISVGPDADETLYEVSTRTIFSEMPLAELVDGYLDNDGIHDPVTIRGVSGFVIEDDATTTLAWSEWPGTATMLRVANHTGRDPFEIAETLIEHKWPTSVTPPLVAFDYGYAWGRSGNNHPYALATVGPDDDGACIAVSFASADSDTGSPQVCTDGPPIWTIGVVSVESDSADALPDHHDVLAGLVPPEVATVRVSIAGGTPADVPTVAVPGLTHRAFGTPTGQPQGSLIEADLQGFDATGRQIVEESMVGVMPTVIVDTVCFTPGTTGIVPDVTNQDLASAYQEIRDAGLILARPVVATHIPTVTGQEPAAGTEVGCGDVLLTTTP